MGHFNSLLVYLGSLFFLSSFLSVLSQDEPLTVDTVGKIRWCVLSKAERLKCEALDAAAKFIQTDPNFPVLKNVECVQENDIYGCLSAIDSGRVDVVKVDAGFAYYAANTFAMKPIAAERYPQHLVDLDGGMSYYVAGVVKKASTIRSLADLKGKGLCSAGVGKIGAWSLPLVKLAKEGHLENFECNVNIKTAAAFFGRMCAPNALNKYNNPFGDNPVSTCELCNGRGSEWCTTADPYAGFHGAMGCLSKGGGDIAFLRDVDVNGIIESKDRDKYELLCPISPHRRSLGDYQNCNWGIAKADILLTSSLRSPDPSDIFREFLVAISNNLGGDPTTPSPTASSNETTTPFPSGRATTMPPVISPTSSYSLFDSTGYVNGTGIANLLVSDSASALIGLDYEQQNGFDWAGGEAFQSDLDLLTNCPLASVRFCVISFHEMRKCEQMVLALQASQLRPSLTCIQGTSTQNCMVKIENDDADIICLDAADVYEAGQKYKLVPIANENYGDVGKFYYAVAVSRRTESRLTLFNLRARNSCHSATRTAAGWIYPVLSLMETVQIKPPPCGAVKAVGELFRRSCVPGILDSDYNPDNTNPINLCENCGSGGYDKCQRNHREQYYGDSGAFRCLTEFGGDIAYTRHTTPIDNTDGRNPNEWSRNRRSDDYELLCKDGRRANIDKWKGCNLAKIPARAVITAGCKTDVEKEIIFNLLNYAQQFYSSDYGPYFQMFDSGLGSNDLLFSDSTVRLEPIKTGNQSAEAYLGRTFLRAIKTFNKYDCSTNSVSGLSAGSLHTVVSLLASAVLCTLLSR